MRRLFLFILVALVQSKAYSLPRDETQKQAFRKENPCPSTGEKKGACPGYQVDHKKALMNGGRDKPENMQWLSEQQHADKTKQDIAECKKSYSCKSKQHKKKLPWEKKPDAKK